MAIYKGEAKETTLSAAYSNYIEKKDSTNLG
jgi:hypothetical protein